MICSSCRKRIPDHSQICPKCDAWIGDSSGLKTTASNRRGSFSLSPTYDSRRSKKSGRVSVPSKRAGRRSSERWLFFWLAVVALVTLIAGMWGVAALIVTVIPVNLLFFGSVLFWRRSPGCLADHYGLIRTFVMIALYFIVGLFLVSFFNYLHLLIVVPLFPGLLGLEPASQWG